MGYGSLTLYRNEGKTNAPYSRKIKIPGETIFREHGFSISASTITGNDARQIKHGLFNAVFDLDKIQTDLFMRTRREGDII